MNDQITKPSPWLPIQRYALDLFQSAAWQDVNNDLQRRDIGLIGASAGAMEGRHFRAGSATQRLSDTLKDQGTHFQLLYVLAGELRVTGSAGNTITLNPGDCMHQPDLANRHGIELMPHSEVMEISVRRPPTVEGKPFALEQGPQAAQMVLNRDDPASYIKGDGPRSYFLYRDLGVSAATSRRIHIHIIRASGGSGFGGTGWHRHTMCQLFLVITGWAVLAVEGQPDVRMVAGDAMCIAAGMRHNVPSFSADYSLLEMCIPADYDTIDTPPAGA